MENSFKHQASHTVAPRPPRKALRNDHLYSLAAILIAIAFSGTLLAGTGRWIPITEPDSASYIDFDWSSLKQILSGIRTPLYPAFVQLARSTMGISAIPFLHFAMMMLAVVLFYTGLTSIGFRPWTAAASAAPLCFSRGLWDFGARIGSDALGIAMSIGCVSFFLMAISKYSPRCSATQPPTQGPTQSSHQPKLAENNIIPISGWIGLGCLTLATILVRPAYLFLIPLWPVLAITLLPFIWGRTWKEAIQTAIKMSLISVLPLLSYCAIRWTVVQEFGLVSFAGYNLIGITGQYVDSSDVYDLPEGSRELAQRLIEFREEAGYHPSPYDYRSMVDLYNKTAWELAAPASETIYGTDTKQSNQALQRLAMSSLFLHPREYIFWFRSNAWSMFQQLVRGAIMDVGSRISLCLLALWGGIIAIQRVSNPKQYGAHRNQPPNTNSFRIASFEFGTLVWISVLFAAAKGLLVVLVEPALGRYVVAVGCFFPACIGLFASLLATRIQQCPKR